MSPAKIRARTPEQIELIRLILTAPPEDSNSCVASRLGASQEWVRQIRSGLSATDLFHDLPRIPTTAGRICTQCTHYEPKPIRTEEMRRNGLCSLGIPEAWEIGVRFAKGCGAFSLKGT
jgi:hypothetical protein